MRSVKVIGPITGGHIVLVEVRHWWSKKVKEEMYLITRRSVLLLPGYKRVGILRTAWLRDVVFDYCRERISLAHDTMHR